MIFLNLNIGTRMILELCYTIAWHSSSYIPLWEVIHEFELQKWHELHWPAQKCIYKFPCSQICCYKYNHQQHNHGNLKMRLNCVQGRLLFIQNFYCAFNIEWLHCYCLKVGAVHIEHIHHTTIFYHVIAH